MYKNYKTPEKGVFVLTKTKKNGSLSPHKNRAGRLGRGIGYRVKTAQSGKLQGCLFDEMVQIVRGTSTFEISKYELEDFIAVLQQLARGLDLSAPAMDSEGEITANLDETERNRVWGEIQRYLDSCQRAQGLNSIVRTVKRARIVDGDPTSLIQSILIERVDSKEITKTRSGRYSLNTWKPQVPSTPATSPVTPVVKKAAAPPKAVPVPVPTLPIKEVSEVELQVWEAISTYLSKHSIPQWKEHIRRAVRRDCGTGVSTTQFNKVFAARVRSKHLVVQPDGNYTLNPSLIPSGVA